MQSKLRELFHPRSILKIRPRKQDDLIAGLQSIENFSVGSINLPDANLFHTCAAVNNLKHGPLTFVAKLDARRNCQNIIRFPDNDLSFDAISMSQALAFFQRFIVQALWRGIVYVEIQQSTDELRLNKGSMPALQLTL